MRRKLTLPAIIVLVLLLAAGGLLMKFINDRWVASAEAAQLRETSEELDNPDRGFYLIHGIVLSDDMDPAQAVQDNLSWDRGHSISLVELNLCEYSGGDISAKGIGNLASVFDGMRQLDMHYIVRFVYDWDGHNMEREPLRKEIVQRHMQQTAPVINDNADIIYTLQGLFVGNWGEMNGTRYTGSEHWRALAAIMAEETDPSVYMAVRMPMQWRCICGRTDAEEASPGIRARMGLFNDGMLGSISDLGTYAGASAGETGYTQMWSRDDELAFQEELCRSVPNGGEVVQGQYDCKFTEALEYLNTVHASYLNEDYDRRVLNGWASETVSGGVWNGTDGLSYIREHLGYRFTASRADVQYSYLSNKLSVSVDIRNVGFAPAYFELRPVLSVIRDGEECFSMPLSGDLRALYGGTDTGSCTLKAEIPVSELEHGDCQIALRIESDRGRIQLANERRMDTGDVIIGGIRSK